MEMTDTQKYTIEEYFSLVEEAEYKLEYYRGQVVAMAGAKVNHNIIGSNLITALSEELADSEFLVFGSRQALAIGSHSVLYPDAMVSCIPTELHPGKTLLLNPKLIIEIRTSNPRSLELTKKFDLYRTIPSLQEYLLLDSESISFQSFFREQDDLWRIASGDSLDQIVPLYSLELQILMERIYKKTLPFENR